LFLAPLGFAGVGGRCEDGGFYPTKQSLEKPGDSFSQQKRWLRNDMPNCQAALLDTIGEHKKVAKSTFSTEQSMENASKNLRERHSRASKTSNIGFANSIFAKAMWGLEGNKKRAGRYQPMRLFTLCAVDTDFMCLYGVEPGALTPSVVQIHQPLLFDRAKSSNYWRHRLIP
jgi:hypothetical protein